MSDDYFKEDHKVFRDALKKLVEKEISPQTEEWERRTEVPREGMKILGRNGFLCPWVDEKYGGSGLGFEYSLILHEEIFKSGCHGLHGAVRSHNATITPYIAFFGSDQQKDRYLPKCVSGDIITAIGMSEPDAGSDLASIRTRAHRDGDSYVINGQKVFISNGISCDLIVLAVKTDQEADPPHKGISLFLVEAETPGFIKWKKMEKMGLHSQDMAELFFENCRIPLSALLGEEGEGWYMMMKNLPQERLELAHNSLLYAIGALEMTIEYVKKHQVAGEPLSKYQSNAFKLVEMATEIELAKSFFDDLVKDHLANRDITTKVSMAKWWFAEMANRVIGECVGLYGVHEYMKGHPMSSLFTNVRSHKILGGTNEIMKVVITKGLGL
jgi:acyl-CoA dehydrogenase